MSNKVYPCEICGRLTERRAILETGQKVCSKHATQFKKFGKFLDNNPRNYCDLNDYKIVGETAIFGVYDKNGNQIEEFIVDSDDVEKIKNFKWRLANGKQKYICTGKKDKFQLLHWCILDKNRKDYPNLIIDHINRNPLDCRKSNLRLCTLKENQMNRSLNKNNASGFSGITNRTTRNKDCESWESMIGYENQYIFLGTFKTLEQAVYSRIIAKEIFFNDCLNQDEFKREKEFTNNLSSFVKNQVKEKVINSLKNKNIEV